MKLDFQNNLKQLLDFRIDKQEKPVNEDEYKDAIKIYQMDNINEPIAHFSTKNHVGSNTSFPISSFLFTTEPVEQEKSATNTYRRQKA